MAALGRWCVYVAAIPRALWPDVWRQQVRKRRGDKADADLLPTFERSGDGVALARLRREWRAIVGQS